MRVNVREILETVIEEESLDKVQEMYKNGEIILTSEDFKGVEITDFDATDDRERAIKYCERLIEKYDRNREINDMDICHIIEILKGRE